MEIELSGILGLVILIEDISFYFAETKRLARFFGFGVGLRPCRGNLVPQRIF